MADDLTLYDQNTKQWLCTTASQIFFMQLGFLCYEVGFVKPVWTQSVILKNIEDTFVGVLTFLILGYTLSESQDTFYGIIAIPVNPMLIGISSAYHDKILISAFFASTCATIISGAVLERMKNGAYIMWCLLIILVNYSFVSHWVWHEKGWLNEMGFVDGAGSVVVHSTAGMSAAIAVWKLGPRKESLDISNKPNDIKLLETQHASRPIINAIGALFLWYGWFAFNVSSPIAFSKGIDDAIGTTALITVISPISSSCSAFVWMWLDWVPLSFENLLSCLLAGLVSITGMCHTCNPLEAVCVGFGASIVYFVMSRTVRNKLGFDDPLQVVAIHLCCGIYSGISEGIVANDTYGTPGLIHGHGTAASFRHFGVQLLGVVVIVTFNFCTSLFLWEIVLKRVCFRNKDIRVSILDIYLGTRLFDQNYDMALHEVIGCDSNAAKKMLFEFHKFVADRYAAEQLDFLIVVSIYNKYLESSTPTFDTVKSAKYILQIINNYVDENGMRCINISGTQRSILLRIRKQLLFELKQRANDKDTTIKYGDEEDQEPDQSASLIKFQAGFYISGLDIRKENIFGAVFESVWRIVIPHFTMYLRKNYEDTKKHKFDVRIPFSLNSDWSVEWDEVITKRTGKKTLHLVDTVPQLNESGTLLKKTDIMAAELKKESGINEVELVEYEGGDSNYPIIFVDAKHKKGDLEKRTVVMIE